MIRKFHEAKINNHPSVTLWGTGTPLREFLHTDDLADACYYLMQNHNERGLVNIGTGKDCSIRQLAETVKNIVGYKGETVWDGSKPDGTPRKLLDITKLSTLGWKAKIGLEEGIRKVYEDAFLTT
jgi:GDP-L-fucose synthase